MGVDGTSVLLLMLAAGVAIELGVVAVCGGVFRCSWACTVPS
jgi:hypothetical protein